MANDWWKEENGQRIGWMYPEEFAAILEAQFGYRAWILSFAHAFGYSRAQVDRWAKGEAPIPKNVAMTVNMISTLRNRNIPLTFIEADYLPDVKGANGKRGIELGGKAADATADAVSAAKKGKVVKIKQS